MTIKELITILQKCNPDAEVFIQSEGPETEIFEVYEETNNTYVIY